jgi:GAF domain-containing protein
MTTPDTQLHMLEDKLAGERKLRQALVDAGVRLNSILNFPELIAAIVASSKELLSARHASVILLEEADNELMTAPPGEANDKNRVPADQGIAGWVLTQNMAVKLEDADSDPRFLAQIDAPADVNPRAMLALPLNARDRTIGVLELIDKNNSEKFDDSDLEIATVVAAQAAIAIDNLRLYQLLTETLIGSCRSVGAI